MTRTLNTLFGKILCWFLLTMALSMAANALVFSLLGERHFDVTRNPPAWEMFKTQLRLLLDTYDRDGLPGLEDALADAPQLRSTLRLYGPDGEDLLGTAGRDAHDGQTRRDLDALLEEHDGPYAFGRAMPHIVAVKTLARGGTATMALELPQPPPPREVLSSPHFWGNLVPLLVVSAVLTFILARMLTRPIRRLRDAARRIAGGDLHHRIGSDVGRGYEEINALSEDFDRMAAKVEQLVSAQRQLLRDISHELRSPLTRLTVALELARGRTGDLARAELDRIGQDAQRLDELITQMLTFIRMDQMDTFPEKTRLNLGALLVSITRDTDVESQAKGVYVDLMPMATALVDAVPELVRRAIENVLRNAIRHTPSGRTVRVTLETRSGPAGPEALVTVHDGGPGVPEDALERLFQPFYRVDASRGHDSSRTGLGLSIARRAITLHHGTIEAGNDPRGGLRMEITLPLAG